jgi:hypothetical protein
MLQTAARPPRQPPIFRPGGWNSETPVAMEFLREKLTYGRPDHRKHSFIVRFGGAPGSSSFTDCSAATTPFHWRFLRLIALAGR